MNQSIIKVLLAGGAVAASAIAVFTSNKQKKTSKFLTAVMPFVADKLTDINGGKLSAKQLTKLRDLVAHLDMLEWHCDECDACLNDQRGFTTKKGHWKCRKCGYDNSVHAWDVLGH